MRLFFELWMGVLAWLAPLAGLSPPGIESAAAADGDEGDASPGIDPNG